VEVVGTRDRERNRFESSLDRTERDCARIDRIVVIVTGEKKVIRSILTGKFNAEKETYVSAKFNLVHNTTFQENLLLSFHSSETLGMYQPYYVTSPSREM
jgi:hypothetical protein